MRIEQFYYLKTVIQEHSINSASKRLHISPQALSRSLIHLEEELNVKLLKRSRYGVVPTEKGQRLLNAAEIFLTELEALSEKQPQSKNLSGEFHLLSTRALGHFVPNLLAQIYLAAPELNIVIDYSNYHDILAKILDHTAEIALTNLSFVNGKNIYEFDEKRLLFYPLQEYHYFCQVSTKLPISVYKTISLKTLLDYPLITYSNSNEYSIISIVEHFGKPRKIIYEENSLLAAEMVNAGLAVAIKTISQKEPLVANTNNNIVNIKITDDIKTIFGFLIHQNQSLSAMSAGIADILKTLAYQ